MEGSERTGLRQRAKKWMKHSFKSSEPSTQDTPVLENRSDSQEDSTITMLQAPLAKLSTRDPEVQDSTKPKDLWQAAYDQLDETQKNILSTVKLPVEQSRDDPLPAREIIDEVVKTTERQFEEYQTGGLKIPGLAGDQVNLRKISEKIINAALSFKDVVTPIAGLDPTQHAASAWAVVSLGLTMAQNHYTSRNSLFQTSEYLANVLARGVFIEKEFYRVGSSKGAHGLESALTQVYRAVLFYTVEVRSAQNPGKRRKIMDCVTAMTDKSFKDLQSSIDKEEQYLQQWVAMDQHLKRRAEAEEQLAKVDRLLSDLRVLRDDSILSKLVSLDDASFDAYQEDGDTFDEYEGRCLPGTRTELLEQVLEWSTSPDSQCIFWLNGMAGTGKSTISRTLATSFKETGILAASFFFKRGAGDRGKAKRLFTTIAKQLVITVPRLIPGITNAIQTDGGVSEKSLSVQFDKLLQQPLLGLEESTRQPKTFVIVIDALDECESSKDIGELLRLLPKLAQLKSVQLRFFLTSRPDVSESLFKGWQDRDRRHLTLHTIPEPIIERDISLFLSNRFTKIREDNEIVLGTDWPGQDTIQKLVEISVPLFIFAATICRFVGEGQWSPKQRLHDFLSHPALTSGSEMDRTYLPILEQPFRKLRREKEKEMLMEEFHSIIGAIVLLATPLSITTLSSIIKIEEDSIANRLRSFTSVLNVPHDTHLPVKTLHLSFRDFLLNTDSHFHVEEGEVHETLIPQCFRVMNSLKQNICDLRGYGSFRSTIPSDTVNRCLSPELQYCCRYWAYHLELCNDSKKFENHVLSFLEEHFLHWLEAMSLMGVVVESVGIFDTLVSIFQDGAGVKLSSLLHDAKRFMRRNVQMADTTPLQLYCSGLIFAPKKSYVRSLFEHEIPPWAYLLPDVEDNWGPHLQTLEGHPLSVRALEFSPDGRLLASRSRDDTVRLWDIATGTQHQALYHDGVTTMAFSFDGCLIATGSRDRTVYIWDSLTGTLQNELCFEYNVWTVAFLPDGCLVVSGSEKRQFLSSGFHHEIWGMVIDIQQRKLSNEDYPRPVILSPHDRAIPAGFDYKTWLLRDTDADNQQYDLKHEDEIDRVVLSSDGCLVASISGDKTICLWDTATETRQHKLEGHEYTVRTVAFSQDSRLVASGSDDKTIRLWDTVTGIQQHILKGHTSQVHAVSFSPDGRSVASGSLDESVRLWDTVTGIQQHIFKGHTYLVQAVSFSPDGRLVASSSMDRSIRLWDTVAETKQQKPKGHTDWIHNVVFSTDGRLIATGSSDTTVRLWETATGIQKYELEGHKSSVQRVAFSPDSRLVASGSADKTVRLWDTAKGTQQHRLDGHGDSICAVAFSPDGRLVVSGSKDNTVRLWDTTAGTQKYVLEGHTDLIDILVFSSDGCLFASGSWDRTVRLWDTAEGIQKHVLIHKSSVQAVIFSPDGSLVAVSDDEEARLWDTTEGTLRHEFKSKGRYLIDFEPTVFSPDGRLFASGSHDGTVRLWDLVTGSLRSTRMLDGQILHLEFSKDGLYLHSNRGSMPVDPSRTLPIHINHQVSMERDWISIGGENLIWVPFEHRYPSASAFYGETMALGYDSGAFFVLSIRAPEE